MSDVKKRFDAAVQVIRNLPKNQTYQPSKELMLRFYSLYKQASIGPCNLPRPAFWDLINKAKWEAWNGLKEMSVDEAMELYVEELKKVIETMPHSVDVGNFIHTLGNFYEIVDLVESEDNVTRIASQDLITSKSLESQSDRCSENSFYEVAHTYFGECDVEESIKRLQDEVDTLNERLKVIETKVDCHVCPCQWILKAQRFLCKVPYLLLIGMSLPLWTLLWFIFFRLIPFLKRQRRAKIQFIKFGSRN